MTKNNFDQARINIRCGLWGRKNRLISDTGLVYKHSPAVRGGGEVYIADNIIEQNAASQFFKTLKELGDQVSKRGIKQIFSPGNGAGFTGKHYR